MRRAFLATAALYNAAWTVFLLVAPERLFLAQPPGIPIMAAFVGALGVCFAVCAVRVRKPLLALGIAAKLSSPAVFVAMALLGWFSWSQAWLPVVNDLIWIPGLVWIYRTP
jgi:hypothetical protein